MEKDLLQAVIKVESEIHQSLESQRKKAAEWLESVRSSLSQKLEAQKRNLEEEYARALEATNKECEIKAKKEIVQVSNMVDQIQNLPDKMLQDMVKRFLQEILPAEERGGDSDCQDGKS